MDDSTPISCDIQFDEVNRIETISVLEGEGESVCNAFQQGHFFMTI